MAHLSRRGDSSYHLRGVVLPTWAVRTAARSRAIAKCEAATFFRATRELAWATSTCRGDSSYHLRGVMAAHVGSGRDGQSPPFPNPPPFDRIRHRTARGQEDRDRRIATGGSRQEDPDRRIAKEDRESEGRHREPARGQGPRNQESRILSNPLSERSESKGCGRSDAVLNARTLGIRVSGPRLRSPPGRGR